MEAEEPSPAFTWPMSERDQPAFDVVYRHSFEEWYRYVFLYLNRQTSERAVAEDIAQEALIRLYQRGRLPKEPRAWLTTVANRLLYDHGRRQRRRRKLLAANPDALQPSRPPEAPDQRMSRVVDRQAVTAALQELPARQRQALLLRHGGLSYREIADVLGLAPAGIGKLIMRANEAFVRAYLRGTHAPDG